MAIEKDLTHLGKPLVELEPRIFGVSGATRRFPEEDLVRAQCVRATLFLQTGGEESQEKTVTGDINLLLKAKEIVRREKCLGSLLVSSES